MEMPWRVFFAYKFAGAILWSVVLSSLGYLFGAGCRCFDGWAAAEQYCCVPRLPWVIGWRVQGIAGQVILGDAVMIDASSFEHLSTEGLTDSSRGRAERRLR